LQASSYTQYIPPEAAIPAADASIREEKHKQPTEVQKDTSKKPAPSSQLAILSINIRGLSAEKLQAVNSYIEKDIPTTAKIDIIVIHELKASLASYKRPGMGFLSTL
jgi:hypothetical protein